MPPKTPPRDSRIDAILSRLEGGTRVEGTQDLKDAMDMIQALGVDIHASQYFDILLEGIASRFASGSLDSTWILTRMRDWIDVAVNRIDIDLFKHNEMKVGVWQNVFFGTAGATVLGLAGLLSIAPRTISPFAFTITGIVATLAIYKRIRITRLEVLDLEKKHGLQLLQGKITRELS